MRRGFSGGWTSNGVIVLNRGDSPGPGSDPVAVAHDLATLTELWRHDLDERQFPEAVSWSQRVALRDGDSLEVLEPRTGKRLWRRDLQPESYVELPGGETVLVGREIAANGLPGPAELFRVTDGAAIATTDLWHAVGIHNGRLLAVRGAADARLNTWLGWVDLKAGSVVAIDWLYGLDPGADCRVEGEWLLCANPPTRNMLVFRL